MTVKERRTFFEMPLEVDGFDQAFTLAVSALKRGSMQSIVADENVQRFSHGRRWNHRASPHTTDGEMQTMSVEWETPFQDIVDGDLTLIPRAVDSIAKQMQATQMRMMYQTISDVCDVNGQTVSVAETGSNAAAFLEMLRKIEFGVDRDGNVAMPEIHAGSEAARKLIADLEAQPPEFAAEIERITTEKSEAALARENERKKRFKASE
ncbi:MAG: hypothetical protein K2Y04_13415 [Caulobacteraceae bacterium]|nr:hypothetical protein [Caulobacteraceae bacterium]